MSIGVSQVRLVFNVDVLSAVSVSSNWLYLTGSPTSVVRINLDSPSNVQDIQIPRKQAASAGHIKLLVASPNGKSILCVTSKFEHFYYSEEQANKNEFKYLSKLKGQPTTCASFYPKRRGCLLLGTQAGAIVEIAVDSSANETYFKRDLKHLKMVWNAPIKETINSISIVNSHQPEVLVCCGHNLLKFSRAQPPPRSDSSKSLTSNHTNSNTNKQRSNSNESKTNNKGKEDEDIVFKTLFSHPPETLVESPDAAVSMLTSSPDAKTLAVCLNSHKVAFHRNSASSTNSKPNEWTEVDIASKVQFLLVTNYYLLVAIDSGAAGSAVMAINLFDQSSVLYESMENAAVIKGGSADLRESTFWFFSSENLYEIKLENELNGMWKVLADQHRYEEALEIADSRASKSYILKNYGLNELKANKNTKQGAKLLGLSDAPLEIACLDVMNADESAVPDLLLARLSHTKSKAQQIMLTSWLVELDDLNVLESQQTDYKVDYKTLQEILLQKGLFDKYLQISLACGDIEACVSYYISNSRWSEALDLLRRHEPDHKEIMYQYASVLMQQCPQETVESWMRMSSLDVSRLLPSLITYSNSYRGDPQGNQALRYLLKYISTKKKQQKEEQSEFGGSRSKYKPSTAVFNVVVTIMSRQDAQAEGGENEDLLKFLKQNAPDCEDLDFALRMCLNYHQYQAAIFLYTLMGLHEDAVQLCLSLGGSEMYDQAVEIADRLSTVNEELRKYLLRLVAQKVIVTQGPRQASRFVGLLRVSDLLANFPDFETLSDLAPEIIKGLEQMNTKLSSLNVEIDDTLQASESMQSELATFSKRSVLVEPGEQCFLCHFPLVTRKFVVFPCQHGFHVDCTQKKLEERSPHSRRDVTEGCVLCSKDNLNQIEQPLSSSF